MNIQTDIKPDSTAEDYYLLSINGVKLGSWEISQIRQLIEDLDNVIHGCKGDLERH